jgi:cbb3-type cytochrome oxidase cytochrome c subunit
MQVALKNFSTHLGSHNFGVDHLTKPHHDHLLSEPREGVEGLQLPFINFLAKDKEAADQFVQWLNWFAVNYDIEAMDLARLVGVADKLTGKW